MDIHQQNYGFLKSIVGIQKEKQRNPFIHCGNLTNTIRLLAHTAAQLSYIQGSQLHKTSELMCMIKMFCMLLHNLYLSV